MVVTTWRPTVTMLALGTILSVAVGAPSMAQESDRAERWQFTLPITWTSGGSYDGSGGTSVDINDDLGFGFGFAYNLDEKIVLGTEFTWLNANYDASIATDFDGDQISDDSISISGTLETGNIQFFGQYNFLPNRMTPFLRGSLGWTLVDSNIPAGPVEGVCWWDPWWGYICNTWQPTYGDTSFSYGAAAGFRGELAERLFLEASYNILWVDFDEAGSTDFDGWRLNVGWTF